MEKLQIYATLLENLQIHVTFLVKLQIYAKHYRSINKVTHLCTKSRKFKTHCATFQIYVQKRIKVTDLCQAKKKLSDLWYICEIVIDLYENYVITDVGYKTDDQTENASQI